MRLLACLFFIILIALPRADASNKVTIGETLKISPEAYAKKQLKANEVFDEMKLLVGVWKKEGAVALVFQFLSS